MKKLILSVFTFLALVCATVLSSSQAVKIGGMYPLKSLPVKWCVNGFDGAKQEDNDRLQEVSKTGTGFMLIKRHVFEKLVDHPATIPFINDIGLPQELNKDMRTFFDTDVREGRYYSEDWTFCWNRRGPW